MLRRIVCIVSNCFIAFRKVIFPGLPFRSLASRRAFTERRTVVSRGAGKDAVQGWIDVAKLVSGGGGVKSAYKDLAYQIGKSSLIALYILLEIPLHALIE